MLLNLKRQNRRAAILAWRRGAVWCGFRRMVQDKSLRREGRAVVEAWRREAAWRGYRRMVLGKGLRRHRCSNSKIPK